MAEFYTKSEVAELLGISKATVAYYAKQNKIRRIPDPYRNHREAIYNKKEVEELVKIRQENPLNDTTPSSLAKELGIPTRKVYSILHEEMLPYNEHRKGKRVVYSLPEETVEKIRSIYNRERPIRGLRQDYYDSTFDIALYQLFHSENNHMVRVSKNEKGEWGFILASRKWIPFTEGITTHQLKPFYSIHQPLQTGKGYTDFSLATDNVWTFDFLDFAYQTFGIENLRLREEEDRLFLSIKSRSYNQTVPLPSSINLAALETSITQGSMTEGEGTWVLHSGYRRTTFDLPEDLLKQIEEHAQQQRMTMSEWVETVIHTHLRKE